MKDKILCETCKYADRKMGREKPQWWCKRIYRVVAKKECWIYERREEQTDGD